MNLLIRCWRSARSIARAALSLAIVSCGGGENAPAQSHNTCAFGFCGTAGTGGTPSDAGPPATPPTCVRDGECPSDRFCAAGVCVPDVCEQGKATCANDAAVSLCTAEGDREVQILCNTGESCTGAEGSARCSDWVCTPDEVHCDDAGLVVKKCSSDGLKVEITKDCGASNQRCVAAECKDVVCEAGKSFCDAQTVYSCSADGTVKTFSRTCTDIEYCDIAAGSCKPKICTAAARDCVDGKPAQCNAEGSAWIPEAACAASEVCSGAECRAVVCVADQTFCDTDGNAHLCNSDGTASSVSDYCTAGVNHCIQNGLVAGCVTNPCEANAKYCDGHDLMKCLPDGTAGVTETNCGATGATCFGGACVPRACDAPGFDVCISGSVFSCVDNGSRAVLVQNCDPAVFYCDKPTATCLPRVCTTGDHACAVGDVSSTCNAEGSGFTDSIVDCLATHTLCSLSGCVPVYVDEVGEWPPNSGYGGIGPGRPSFVGNVFDVREARILTKIAMHVTFPETVQMTWEVYENVGGVYRSIATTVTTQPAVNGFAESGALNVNLLVGHTYAIGFVYSPPTSDFHTINSFCDVKGSSFASVVGAIVVDAPTSPDEFPAPSSTGCTFREQVTLRAP
jgi:hypothetical protein